MPDRLHRGSVASARAQRAERLMLPAVILLLLVGAAFVVLAWSEAEDAVSTSKDKDHARVEQLADAVHQILQRRWLDQSRWVEANGELSAPGREGELRRELATRVGQGTSPATVAWLVVREDGTFAGVGESTPGRLVANGIADDLRTLGRTVAARSEPGVSGRLKLGDEYVFATGAPIDPVAAAGQPASLLVVTYLERSAIGAFIGEDGSPGVANAMLVDRAGRVLLGSRPDGALEQIRRPVGSSGWMIEATHDEIDQTLPGWAHPLFALLLVVFAVAHAIQDLNRRRLRRLGDRRALEVHALYQLASRALYAESIEEQATGLARSAMQLVSIDAAQVHVETNGGPLESSVGTMGRGMDKTRIAIVGPRGPLGDLIVGRLGEPLDPEEQWALQTAAALVGAAMHTLVSLDTERSAAAELQRLDELRSNLLATVAHELLSPLTAVKGVLGLLSMQDDLGERGREFVDVATERTDRLVALIRDLFDCSLLETGQLDIRPRRQRADELLDAALGAQAAARPGELRLSATPNLLITVDPVRFDQMVNNLVTNAFRHGAPPVEVAVRPADGGAIVVVSDEGPGIPESDRDEIFGKFWQGSSGHARMVQGAGLGLSLVQGLVRVHGGDITIDSTHADGRGARFTAFFPDSALRSSEAPEGIDEAPTLV